MRAKILITGASSGIGEATAYAYSNPECELFLVARREQRLTEVAEACLKKGVSRVVFKARDLSVPGQGASILHECLEELGGLNLLICNAGYGIYGPLQEVSPQEMAMDTRRVTRKRVPAFCGSRQRSRRGHICRRSRLGVKNAG